MAPVRTWCVTVENRTEGIFAADLDRIACKFTLTSMPGLTVEEFERAMAFELVNAIRKIKKEMIMKGIEP